MTAKHQKTARVTIRIAIEQTGMSRRQIKACITRSLVAEPLGPLDLQDLRRVRRLQELGINLAGIEIILRMRARMERLQSELARQDGLGAGPQNVHSAQLWQRLLVWEPDQETEPIDGDAALVREY